MDSETLRVWVAGPGRACKQLVWTGAFEKDCQLALGHPGPHAWFPVFARKLPIRVWLDGYRATRLSRPECPARLGSGPINAIHCRLKSGHPGPHFAGQVDERYTRPFYVWLDGHPHART